MYDTIAMRLPAYECAGVDYLELLPQHLTGCNLFVDMDTGEQRISGRLGNLKVSASSSLVQVREGSLCKWFLGDNFQILDRQLTMLAIEKLSDELHLPMGRADVTRLDIASNLIMEYPPETYFRHLGSYGRTHRLVQPSSLYYTLKSDVEKLCFYDKMCESSAAGVPVPEAFRGHNVLRYEQRYCNGVARRLKRAELKASTLYDSGFHAEVVKRWRDTYCSISKIDDSVINFSMVKTKKDLHRLGMLSLANSVGGANVLIDQVNNARRCGQISTKQAYDLRSAVLDACKADGAVMMQSEAILELDKKVKEAARLYV